ncbi:MAG: hypothetical protein ACREX4_20185 [Gammaproteobacteria bacterium]
MPQTMYVVSDPYQATAVQPTEFRLKVDSQPEVVSPVATDAAGLKFFKHQVSGMPNGVHSIIVKACNLTQCSAFTPPFAFALGAPGVPGPIRLVADTP